MPKDNIEFKNTGFLTTIDRLSNIMFMAEIFRALWLSAEVCFVLENHVPCRFPKVSTLVPYAPPLTTTRTVVFSPPLSGGEIDGCTPLLLSWEDALHCKHTAAMAVLGWCVSVKYPLKLRP